MPFMVPLWLKIFGPIALLAVLVGGVKIYGASQYRSGHKAGEAKVEAAWQKASAELKKDAAASATRADDKAITRLEDHVEQVKEDQEKIDEAKRTGSSPLDALFGA